MIIFDLDGTLSIVGDRVKYLLQEPKDWDSFYDACIEDAPNTPIVNICRHLLLNFRVVIVTGRRESCRSDTLKWLHRNNLWVGSPQLVMRPDGDIRHDTVLKPELIEPYKTEIECIFEDRNSMVKKWRELGYTCLQVAEGDF